MPLSGNAVSPPPPDAHPDAYCVFDDGSTKQVYISSTIADAYIPGSYRAYGTGPGTLTLGAGQSTTVSAEVSASVSAEAGIILSKASVQFGTSLGWETNTYVSSSYSINVPAGQTMYIEAGGHGRGLAVQVDRFDQYCNIITTYGSAKTVYASGNIWYMWGNI